MLDDILSDSGLRQRAEIVSAEYQVPVDQVAEMYQLMYRHTMTNYKHQPVSLSMVANEAWSYTAGFYGYKNERNQNVLNE